MHLGRRTCQLELQVAQRAPPHLTGSELEVRDVRAHLRASGPICIYNGLAGCNLQFTFKHNRRRHIVAALCVYLAFLEPPDDVGRA